jgi:hypothetical protein
VASWWAIPIMLRLALIENLRRVAHGSPRGTIDRTNADIWADQMMEVAESDPKSLILVIADMARSNPPMASSFVAELARRLQGQSPALALPLTWIEQRLFETGSTIEQQVQSEAQEQAGDQVSIGNTIGSLRFLGAMDWRAFVETMSFVRAQAARGPGRPVRRDGFRDARSLPACGRENREGERALRNRGWRAGRSSSRTRRQGAATRTATTTARRTWASTSSTRARRSSSARRRCASPLRRRGRVARSVPLVLYLGGILAITAALTRRAGDARPRRRPRRAPASRSRSGRARARASSRWDG